MNLKKSKSKKSNRILVVEDDKNTNEMISVSLRLGGFEVLSVLSGEEALKSIDQALPDLIILDLLMPGLDGWELCKILRKENKPTRKIPIIIVSAISKYNVANSGMAVGTISFFNKPFRPKDLLVEANKIIEMNEKKIEKNSIQ